MQNNNATLTKPINYSREIINAAIARAKDLEKDSLATIAKAHQEAKIKGFEDGLRQLLQHLSTLTAKLELNKEQCQKDTALQAIEIAKIVIGEELHSNPDSILARIKRALSNVSTKNAITICVNPKHIQAIQSGKIDHFSVKLKPDGQIPLGTAIIKTPDGEIISSPESHMNDISKHITNLYNQ